MSRLKTCVTAVVLILLLGVSAAPLHAQEPEIVLQLAVPGYMEDTLNNGVLDQFEAEHPGVRVELVTSGGSGIVINFGSTAGQGDIEDILDEREKYARSADVLAVSSSDLTPEVAEAGYFLDLAPLVNTDPDLNSADYYTAAWQSFQWDTRFWALPVSADPILIFYDKAAFDAANLPYPDTWRSFVDAEQAIRMLTKFNADGTVASPGYMNFESGLEPLLLSLLGQGVYDDSVQPSVPNFNSPDLEAMLTAWAQMYLDGLFDPAIPEEDENTIIDPPLQMGRSAFSIGIPGKSTPKTPALFPGGRAGIEVNGFAISSGTQYPAEAYELVKFLSSNPYAATGFIGTTPARRDVSPNENSVLQLRDNQSPELVALIPVAMEQAYPVSETRFVEYLSQAVEYMVEHNVDARTALQAMEEKALARLDAASTRRESTQITVQTPLPTANLAPGEIALTFGVSSVISPLPNQDQWDALAENFAASDPEVGLVQVKSGFADALPEMAENYDCFFASSNVVPNADLSLLRSLDPLLATDPAFDPNDMVNGVMQQVQRDGQTWGLPVMIQPLAMRYDAELFAQAGAAAPVNGWTVEEFEYALEALKTAYGDSAPFIPRTFDNTHLLMLIAAYGGLPLDYRTTPPTINFTDPNTVAAIQRVLDLAQNGYMNYSELASVDGAFAISMGEDDTTPLYTENLGGIMGVGGGGMAVMAISGGPVEDKEPQPRDPLATFPQGSTYTAMAYDVSAAYISANTPHPEACYRLISELARNTDLITGMPARRSIINSPEIASVQGPETVAFYQAMDALMQQPNTVIIPSGVGFDPSALGNTLLVFWLNRAFDRYVKEDADLAAELADAEMFTKDYQACIAAIAPYDPTSTDFRGYFQQFLDCAVQVDPSVEEAFGG